MENYISINGKKTELTEEQVKQLRDTLAAGLAGETAEGVLLSAIPVAETFKIDEYEFVVLEQLGETTAVILKGLFNDSRAFGLKNNNYDGSFVDEECESFADEIAAIIGNDNLVTHTVDLTSDDGLKDYDTIQRQASLLTADLYRRYVDILDKFKINAWWWLATAHSTAKHGNDQWVKCVAPSGSIHDVDYDYVNGVRPFCILKSNIFVSK